MRMILYFLMMAAAASTLFAGTAGILEGNVVDKDTHDPLIGASVQIIGTTQGAATDLEGHFLISNVEAGSYDLRVTNVGYQTVVYKDVVVRPDLRTKVSIEMVQT